MERPEFQESDNYNECANACENAENGDFKKAYSWLVDAKRGLEYLENADNFHAAADFISSKLYDMCCGFDTRYYVGVASLYQCMANKLTNELVSMDKAMEFVDSNIKWHENNRHDFKVKSDWFKIIDKYW